MAWFKVEHRKGAKWTQVHIRDFQNIHKALSATEAYFTDMNVKPEHWRVKPSKQAGDKEGRPC